MPKPIFDQVKQAVAEGKWDAKVAASWNFLLVQSDQISTSEIREALVLGAGPGAFGFVKQIIDAGVLTPNKAKPPVLVLEAAEKVGIKSVYGGAFWPNDPVLFPKEPNYFEDCPYDRKVVKKNDNIHLVTAEGKSFAPPVEPGGLFRNSSTGYITPKHILYPYFWSKLHQPRDAGYFDIRTSQAAEKLILNEKGAVVGIVTFTGEKYFAKTVVDATGCGATFSKNLSKKILNNREGDFFFGAKLICKMENAAINQAFGLKSNEEGCVLELAGNISSKIQALPGIVGIYPGNGIVNVSVLYNTSFGYVSGLQPHDVMNEILSHPAVKEVTQGSTPLEWSACRLPELHFKFMPHWSYDGYLPVGDTLGLVDFLRKHGINMAIASGAFAADTFAQAVKNGQGFSREQFASYEKRLRNSWIGKRLMSGFFKMVHRLIHKPIFYKTMAFSGKFGRQLKSTAQGLASMTHSQYMALNGELEGQPEIIIKNTSICASCPTEACFTSDPCQAFVIGAGGVPVLDPNPVVRDEIKGKQKKLTVFRLINAEGCLECGNCQSACPEDNVLYTVPGHTQGKHGQKNKGVTYRYN